MQNFTLTPEFIISLAGALLSLIFSYVPGADVWYAKLDPVRKRLFMAGLMLLAVLAVVALSCTNTLQIIVCEKAGFVLIITLFFQGMVVNQAAFLASPPTDAVRAAKQ